jgi:phage FluMu protein Com
MTLQEVVQELDGFDRATTIYAVYPWQPSSNAIVARPQDERRVPDEAIAAGCRHFLEVHIALQLHHLMRQQNLGETEECAKLIEYAEFVSGAGKPYPFPKRKFPVKMMIYCRECGRLFDIVVMAEGSHEYSCPVCGKVQTFNLNGFIEKAVEQSRKMLRKPLGGR